MSEVGNRWLLVGGAGYIGSHIVRAFNQNGIACVVLDNFSSGSAESLPDNTVLIECDAEDAEKVAAAIRDFRINGVIHLAALKHSGESQKSPSRYWQKNTRSVLGVISAMARTGLVSHFILSSSCSVYGNQPGTDIFTQRAPESPYGRTKQFAEDVVQDCANELGYAWFILRYFNVIGCDNFPGSLDTSEHCVVPRVTNAILKGEDVVINGRDYETPDGTCIRDYIDVRDVAAAHVAAALALTNGGNLDPGTGKFANLGTGAPVSVLQVTNEILSALNSAQIPMYGDAREGDPVEVWSKPHTSDILDWTPKFTLKESIQAHVSSAIKGFK